VAWRVRLCGGPADGRSLVVPTLAEVFHWYDPWTPPPIDLSEAPVRGEVAYRYDQSRRDHDDRLVHRYVRVADQS
jgi:hypothetical protein